MAPGLFGVTRARDLKLGLEPRPYDGVERVIVDLQMIRLLDPLAQCFIGGKPGRLPEGLLDRRQPIGGQPEGLASRDMYRQQGLQAASLVAPAPVADGMAVNSQELGHLHAGLSWPTGQHIQHLEPWFLATITFMLEPLLEDVRILSYDR
jgi:hypothetical protein